MADLDASQHVETQPASTLRFASSWPFWSITTSLSLAAHLINVKAATASGIWAALIDLYQRATHGLFGDFPALLATSIGLSAPHMTAQESAVFGLLFMFATPLVIYLASVRAFPVALLLLAAVFANWLAFAYGGDLREEWLWRALIIPGQILVLGLIVTSFLTGGRGLLFYSKNLLGAAAILTTLATTGMFTIN